jgi:hypothetical protein
LIRPTGVSSEAGYVFIFGKSAAWFDCHVDDKRDVEVCSAWDDHGRLETSDAFRLRDEKRAATRAELLPSLVGPADAPGHSDIIYLFGPDRLIIERLQIWCILIEYTGNGRQRNENKTITRNWL